MNFLLPTYFYLYLIREGYEKLYINYIYSYNHCDISCNLFWRLHKRNLFQQWN